MSRGGHGCPQADDGGEQVLINDERLMITDCPWLLYEPNEKEGKKLLEEIMKGGNLGQYAYSGRYPFTNSGDIRSVRW